VTPALQTSFDMRLATERSRIRVGEGFQQEMARTERQ
jgi:hypothetical protein